MRICGCLFFFKQKTAYEMRISDWSSDVCSSDLLCPEAFFSSLLKLLEHCCGGRAASVTGRRLRLVGGRRQALHQHLVDPAAVHVDHLEAQPAVVEALAGVGNVAEPLQDEAGEGVEAAVALQDRKSKRLNSSH